MIQLGARWRIGDGSSVKIFKDSWLPNVHSERVLSPVSVSSEDATVDQLLDSESRWWNTNLVDLFLFLQKLNKLNPFWFAILPRRIFYSGLFLGLTCIRCVQGIIYFVICTKMMWLHLRIP